MKKLLTVSILTLIICQASIMESFSQNLKGDHEFSAGAGFVTTDQIIGVLIDITRTLGTLGYVQSDNVNYTGAFYFNYRYYISPKVAAGLSLVADKASGDLVDNDDNMLGHFKRNAVTIAPEMTLSYVNNKSFRLYGLIGVGYTIGNEKSTNDIGEDNYTAKYNHFNFQISPIAFRVGGRIGAFAEIGFGYKGIIGAGINGYF